MTKTRQVGIRDWSAKKALLKALYCVGNNKALVQEVVEGWPWIKEDRDVKNAVEKCYDTFRRWDRSKPSGERSHQFWNQIISDKFSGVSKSRLWSCSIVEFVGYCIHLPDIKIAVDDVIRDSDACLDEDTKNLLRKQVDERSQDLPTIEPILEMSSAIEHYCMHCHTATNFEGPEEGLRRGRIQSGQFFNIPASTKAWAALVESKGYGMYLDCLLSLKKMVQSDCWKDVVGSGAYDVAVTLAGGGSPEKDWVLATNVLGASNGQGLGLEYMIIDISRYMIHESAKSLHRRLVKNGLNRQVQVSWWNDDILTLDVRFPRPARWKSVVWALLGGTIGNMSEFDFFRSIAGPSKAGDLLVIGIDTFDAESAKEFEERIHSQYPCKETDALLLAPLEITAAGPRGDGVSVKVSFPAQQDESEYSDVPKSRTAVFSIPSVAAGNGDTVLAVSTRYAIEEFLEYARQFGWEHLGAATSSSNSTFRQLMLRRVK